MSVADAFVKCWKWKYHFFSERPNTFVPEFIDKKWESFWPDPPFPSFPSGHAIQASAAVTALLNSFENNIVYISFEADGEADEKESEIEEKILPYNRSVALPKIVENSCPIFFDQNSYASVDQKYFSPPPEAK